MRSESDIEALRILQLNTLSSIWESTKKDLHVLLPHAMMSARLRPDIYNTADGILARDSAGIRLLFWNVAQIRFAATTIFASFNVTDSRDYLKGHPRACYYRAFHMYLLRDGFEVELQLRTTKQHRIANWAHDRLFRPSNDFWLYLSNCSEILAYFTQLSHYYELGDEGQPATVPLIPAALVQFKDEPDFPLP